jgi:hypothetical protein
MQDDQDKATDELTLAGNPSLSSSPQISDPGQSGTTIPDPALEALNLQQSEQPPETTSDTETAAPLPAPASESVVEPPATTGAASSVADSSLDPIKKEALKKLEPLVNELDLHPEEKYRALMMIIQATDNKDLVNEAFQAADKIEDNKTRAQALLSIVNEIEYFKNKEIASSE